MTKIDENYIPVDLPHNGYKHNVRMMVFFN